jgi:DNA-binding CsgD family transcriptional regulator
MALEIVGRDEELAALHRFVARQADGPAALVLSGEAGIGKSTLWRAGVEAARERGLRVLAARPTEAEQPLDFTGLGDLLDGVASEVLPELTAPQRRALEVALLIDELPGRADSRALGVAVRSSLRLLSRDEPLVLAIDDVQWLDAATATALEFALRRLRDERILLLVARRLGEHADPRGLGDLEDSDRTERLHVRPLSVGAIHRLVHARLDQTFARPALLRLHEVSGGNPFYALELARGLDRAAQVVPVPETLTGLVRHRLAPLPAETRTALLALAMLGRSRLAVLHEAGVAEHTLEPALAADVVAIAGDEVRFTHPLLSSTIYGDASAAERRRLHGRLAQVVTEPVARARHLALACEGAAESVARELEHAASVARARGAVSAAAELAELAGRRTPAEAADDGRRRLLQAARDHVASGTPDKARALGQEVLAHAATGLARAQALALLGEVQVKVGKPRMAVTLLRDALAEEHDDGELKIVLHGLLAWQLQNTEGLSLAERHARAAVRLAEGVDEPLASRALVPLAATRLLAGEPDALQLIEDALERARSTGDPDALAAAAGVHGQSLLILGRLDEARQTLSECHHWAADHDETTAIAMLFFLAHTEHRAGRWEVARSHAERIDELEAHYPPEDRTCMALLIKTLLAAYEGDEGAARALAEQTLSHTDTEGEAEASVRFTSWEIRSLLALLDHWGGHPGVAVEHFEAVDREQRASGFRGLASFRSRAEYVEALLQLGRVDEAGAILADWEEAAVRQGSSWELAGAARCRGLLAAAAGAHEEAAVLLEAAVARHESVGDRFGRSRALLSLGLVRRGGSLKRAAREAIEAALAGFEQLGARGWEEKARAELGRIGGRSRDGGLTPAERRVAALVAEGRTNREVAAALFLGERTVETHLTHVYAKLGIRSRTELARTYS